MEEQQVFAYEFEGTRYDAGTTMGWLKASVEIALDAARPRHRVPGLPPGPPALSRVTTAPLVRYDADGRARDRPDRTRAPDRRRGDDLAEIGQVLGGRYRLIELLGQGGMATIYRATDTGSVATSRSSSSAPSTCATPTSRRASARRPRPPPR